MSPATIKRTEAFKQCPILLSDCNHWGVSTHFYKSPQ